MINYPRSFATVLHVQQGLSTRAHPKRVCAIAIAFAALCAIFPSLLMASNDPFRYRGGLRNSPDERKLNAKQLDTVLTSLRDKTGFLEMRFDENGFLTLGDRTKFSGGSATARALLDAAVKMPRAVDLESHTYSSLVAFARLATPIAYQHYSTGKKIDVFPLQIDFSDLSKLRGDKLALTAFDIGFVVLHEMGHAALGLRDAAGDPEGLGECEELINRIRRELNLPERQTYIARIQTVSAATPSQISTKQAELIFARAVEKQGRMQMEKFNLRWEAAKVGPIVEIPVQSLARIRNSKPITATSSGQ
ncbi:MAG: hypothetical protein AB7U82_16030 [Blastocatellales bacterium]